MRTSVAFLSSMALAMARAVAFDVRAIGVLLVDMMLKYIGFHRRRQQICRGGSTCDSCADVRCRTGARSPPKEKERLQADRDVEPHRASLVQVHERCLGQPGDQR